MLVRNLRPQDIDLLLVMMSYYRDEVNISDEDWDENSVIQSIKFYATNLELTCLVAVENSRIVGCLLASMKKEFYNNNVSAAIQMLYLLPSHRQRENYQQLYNEFLNWTIGTKLEKILLIDIVDRTDRLDPISDMLDFSTSSFKIYLKDAE